MAHIPTLTHENRNTCNGIQDKAFQNQSFFKGYLVPEVKEIYNTFNSTMIHSIPHKPHIIDYI